MLEIDGSYGEGGGQILRNAVALSVLTNKSIKILNIRANRPNPGMKAQHYVALKSIAEITNAEVKGLKIGSSQIYFKPNKIKSDVYKFDIGTAGSITLVFQACILALTKFSETVTIRLTGGTDVRWSPPWDYFQNVYLPIIKKMGITVQSKLLLRGYYPKGGGEALIKINPTKKIKPLKCSDQEKYEDINGNINITNLPDHIPGRIKHTAIKTLLKNNYFASVKEEKSTSLSPGVGICLWCNTKNTVIGASFLGEKGITSEEVGQTAANNLLEEINSNVTLDKYAFDQILPYLVLSRKNGKSVCRIKELTNHASTNMWLLQQFYDDVKFEAIQNEENIKISVQ